MLVAVVVVVLVVLVPRSWCSLDPPCVLPAEASAGTFFTGQPAGTGPRVGWVEIVPADVTVEPGPGVEFTLEVVVRDEDGFVIPPVLNTPVTWTIPAPLLQAGAGPSGVTVKVSGSVAQARVLKVTAAAGSPSPVASLPASIRLAPAATSDRVTASHVNGTAPTVTLADVKLQDNTLLSGNVLAFVREKALGDVLTEGNDWASILILSPSSTPAVERLPAATSAVALNAAATAGTLLPLKVAVWIAVPPLDLMGGLTLADVSARAHADLSWTNDAYARSRAGVQFVLTSPTPIIVDPALVDGINAACRTQDYQTLPVVDGAVMNVYYVGRSGPEGISGRLEDVPVACLGWPSQRSLSVLAHELGHGLGLQDEYVWPESPFTATNVMGYLRSGRTAPRDRLSTGQVFRVVLSHLSWLVRGGGVSWDGVDCSSISCPDSKSDLPGTAKP